MVNLNGRPWCTICRVEYKIGGEVVTPRLGPNNLGLFGFIYPGPPLEHPDPATQNDDGNDNDDDDDNNPANNVIRYSATRWDGIRIDETFHEECLRGISSNTLRKLLYQTAYTYIPMPREFERRLSWLKNKFSQPSEALYPMPDEMRHIVVTHGLPRLTTVYVLSGNSGPNGWTPLFLTKPIWAQYITFEGRLYISALTNEAPVTDDTGAGPKGMVKLRKPEGPLAAIHVALDHLGIRRVVLTDNRNVDLSDYPVDTSIGGWVSLPLSGQTYIHCERDGHKLRRILYNGLDQTLWRYLWPVPQSQPNNLRLWSPDERTFQAPMRYLHLNKPNTRGYSICWFYELMTICPKYAGGDPPYYDGWDIDRPKTIWAYLPIDQGETIVELWEVDAATSKVLVLTTSHGRTLTLGVRPKPVHGGRAWVLQDRIEGERTLLAEESWSGLGRIAFPTPRPTQQGTPPTILPPVKYPESKQELWYSSAELTGVVSMRICKMKAVIIGLLFSYEDGRERTLGEVRFDRLEPQIETKGTRGVVYQVSESEETKRKTVVELRTWDPEEAEYSLENEEMGRHCVPWRGTWHWWFSYLECMLSHEDEVVASIVEDM